MSIAIDLKKYTENVNKIGKLWETISSVVLEMKHVFSNKYNKIKS